MNDIISRTARTIVALPALALCAGLASASIVRVDEPGLGASLDGFNITRDAANNLDWLDWSLTVGRSYNNVVAELLSPGKPLADWRFATAGEFAALVNSAAIPASHIDRFEGGAPPSELVTLAMALGITHTQYQGAHAAFGTPGALPGTMRLGGITLAYAASPRFPPQAIVDLPNDPKMWLEQDWPVAMGLSTLGAALVRQSPIIMVSAPASLALLAIGFLTLAMSRRASRVRATGR